MILSKSRIYETKTITPELLDKKFQYIFFLEIPRKGLWFYAAQEGYKKLVKYSAIYRGNDMWDNHIFHAAKGGREKLIDFLIPKSPIWTFGGLIAHLRIDLIQFFISRGFKDFRNAELCTKDEKLKKYFRNCNKNVALR